MEPDSDSDPEEDPVEEIDVDSISVETDAPNSETPGPCIVPTYEHVLNSVVFPPSDRVDPL